MVLKTKFRPGQKVSIVEAEQVGRVNGLLITTMGVTYNVRWWDGSSFQDDYFEDSELQALESTGNFAVFCDDSDHDSTEASDGSKKT